MRHNLNTIADNYNLNKEKLIEFALKHENYNKYGIINENGHITTSTWFTNDLIKDFREHINLNKIT